MRRKIEKKREKLCEEEEETKQGVEELVDWLNESGDEEEDVV